MVYVFGLRKKKEKRKGKIHWASPGSLKESSKSCLTASDARKLERLGAKHKGRHERCLRWSDGARSRLN